MPKPLRGLVAIAEYGSKFEADAAVALLQSVEIDATPSYDPAMNSVATYFASDRTFEVLVRTEDVDRARVALEEGTSGLPDAFTGRWEPTGRTPARSARSLAAGCVMVALVLPLVLLLVSLVIAVTR